MAMVSRNVRGEPGGAQTTCTASLVALKVVRGNGWCLQAKSAQKKQKDKEELARQKAKKDEELKNKQAKAAKGERRR
jgi:hypothetical protein